MPIKGLSERRRLPRLGKIRTGVKVQGKKSEYPKAVDYFVLPEDEYGKKLGEVFGEKPRSLRIVFPVDDPNVIFPQWYKAYRTSIGLFCKGDGEHATQVDEQSGELVEVQCPCERLENKSCRQMGNLVFMVPEVSLAGVFQIDTSSFNSIVDLNSGIDFLRSVRGRVAMQPCILTIEPREVSPDGKKKVVYTMHIIPAEGEALRETLLPIGDIPKDTPQLEGPKEEVGAGHVEEKDLVPASVQTGEQDRTDESTQDRTWTDTDDFETDAVQVTKAQAEALGKFANQVCDDIGYKKEKLRKEIYAQYGVSAFSELTEAQAAEIRATLEAWRKEKSE
jgi:hypothetical protein